jgi:hypothetical protein
MQTVSRFEANLLSLLHFFLRHVPAERAASLLEYRSERPTSLSEPALALVKDALRKGPPLLLARDGGWRRERHLRGDRVVEGRLWERTAPEELGLAYSRNTLAFLVWITAARPADKDFAWRPESEDLTLGDLLLFFYAHEGLRSADEKLGAAVLRRQTPFAEHGLCWLAYPEDYAGAPEEQRPDFGPWVEGRGACILEALQPLLLARWIAVESRKERIADARQMRELGQSQERVLTAFLDAVEKAGRLDLARFLLQAAAVLVGPHAHFGMWTGRLRTTGLRIADRADSYQAAVVFLRQLERLHGWERRARGIGYFDEGYAASQLWKADWERYDGETMAGRAAAIVAQLDPMQQT